MSERHPDPDRLAEALRLLAKEARERLRRQGAENGATPKSLDLQLTVPLQPAPEPLARSREQLDRELDEEVASWLRRQALARPGRAHCLRCRSSECEHAAPGEPREVFAGYGPTGMPRFVDFGQLLLEQRDPRVEVLYGERSGFATLRLDAAQLTAALLPAYRGRNQEVALSGQVCAGWYPVPDRHGNRARLAVTFQVLSAGRGRRRRYALHLVGHGAEPAVLEALHAGGRGLPWREAMAWAEEGVRSIEAAARGRRSPPSGHLERRIEGLLHHFAERLERPFRSRRRQTAHARDRHHSGRRPTRAALGDLFDAPAERVFFDGRHRTYVVLGRRGRTHVFSDQGKLVTSLRYAPGTVERRQKAGEWRPVPAAEAAGLVERVRLRSAEEGDVAHTAAASESPRS